MYVCIYRRTSSRCGAGSQSSQNDPDKIVHVQSCQPYRSFAVHLLNIYLLWSNDLMSGHRRSSTLNRRQAFERQQRASLHGCIFLHLKMIFLRAVVGSLRFFFLLVESSSSLNVHLFIYRTFYFYFYSFIRRDLLDLGRRWGDIIWKLVNGDDRRW